MNNNKIIPLSGEKTVVFYSPLEFKDFTLVRSSNSKEDFLNALIISNYKDYWFLKKEKKDEFYNDVLNNITKGDTNYNFVKNIFLDFYKHILEDKKIKNKYENILNPFIENDSNKEVFSIIFENINYQDLDHFFNKCYSEEESNYDFSELQIEDFMDFIFTKIENNEDEKLTDTYKKFFLKTFTNFLKKVEENYPQKFQKKLSVNMLNFYADFIEKNAEKAYKIICTG
jgi:hypothetical protein